MSNSINLGLPYLAAAQAQKHVTVNEALRLLDGVVQLSVISDAISVPPGAPSEGDRYLIASGGSGAWLGWAGSIGYYADGAWQQLDPVTGWHIWVESSAQMQVYDGTAWQPLIVRGEITPLATAPAGAASDMVVIEELLSGLSGATVDSTVVLPDRAIVLGVSVRVISAITGASSFDIGTAASSGKFGATLSIAAGTTNIGVIGPEALYSDTAIRITANGGNFTGGDLRIALHYIAPRAPQS